MKRLVVTGGGTGGHVTPALALAEAFLVGGEGREVLYLGSSRGLEAKAAPAAGLPFRGIPARGFRGKSITGRILFLTTLLRGFLSAHGALRRFKPDAVLATGSYVSAPVILAARLRGIPLFIQEQNSMPGSVNRLAARSAKAVFIAFPEAEDYFESAPFLELLGNPLRAGFHADRPAPGPRPRILITGGSLGARTLCRAAIEALPFLAERFDFEAVVQTGSSQFSSTREALQSMASRVEVLSFIHDMPARMAAADLIVARAGAMTLAEITALGKPALLVPYPYATDDHQTANARSLVEAGAARLVADDELDGLRLLKELDELLGDKEALASMGQASLSLGRPDAAKRILARMENILAASGSR